MNGFSCFTINFRGSRLHLNGLIDALSMKIQDQGDFEYLFGNETEDDEDLYEAEKIEWTQDIDRTRDCIWFEDIAELASEMAASAGGSCFTIVGYVYDESEDETMDFRFEYRKKLTAEKSDWYIEVHMGDYEDYEDFCRQFCDLYGNPRYSEEEYRGFKDCANEWYVLEGGRGEFSSNVPLGMPFHIRVRKK